MTRTIVIATAAVVIAIGIIISGFFLFRYVTRTGGILGPLPSPSPSPAQEIFSAVSTGNVITPIKDVSGTKIRYFDFFERKLKEIDFEAAISRTISNSEFHNVFNVNWSPVSNQVVLEYVFESEDKPKEFNPYASRQLVLFDPATGASTQLNPFIDALAWSPDGKKIIYHYRNDVTNENFIALSNPDGNGREIALRTALLSLKPYWILPETVIIVETPTPAMPSLVLSLNLADDTLRIISRNYYGVSILPSPDGRKLLVSSTEDPEGMRLVTVLLDTSGNLLKSLPFATLAEKCAWSTDNETLYCAVPETFGYGGVNGLPFRYWTGEVSSRDELIKYKFTSGEKTSITEGAINADIVELVIPYAENAFGFINRFTGKLSVFKR